MRYTDRSRFVLGHQCQLKRYWTYHHAGKGLSSPRLGLELWTGLLIHAALAKLLELVQPLKAVPPPEALREAWAAARAEAERKLPWASDFTIQEQSALAEGLYWAFIRSQLPYLLEHYEIVAIEQEIELLLEADLTLMTRPDLVLRRKSTGKLVLCDFKSTSGLGDQFLQEFRDSPQMAAYTLAIEKHFGEPVEEYMIWALVKGSRKKFTKKGMPDSPEPRQYSSLCYAKFQEPNPPLSPDTSWDLGGFWYDKQPTWLQNFSQAAAEESPLECFVRLLPQSILFEQFAIIGPYPRQQFAGQLFLDSLKGEEARWQKKLQELGAKPTHEALIRVIGPSYACWSYGSRCSFYDLCFKIGQQDPLESGWEPREPHHATEKI